MSEAATLERPAPWHNGGQSAMRRKPTPKIPVIDRFWASVDKSGDCWLWLGTRSYDGYGRFWDGRHTQATRWIYERTVGSIEAGLQLDHLCRNRACVNPDHLEPVTQRENTLRGIGFGAVNARKTHCPRGHPLTEAISRKQRRRCLVCKREAAVADRKRLGAGVHHREKTHCVRGHPLEPPYIRLRKKRRGRMCLICRAINEHRMSPLRKQWEEQHPPMITPDDAFVQRGDQDAK